MALALCAAARVAPVSTGGSAAWRVSLLGTVTAAGAARTVLHPCSTGWPPATSAEVPAPASLGCGGGHHDRQFDAATRREHHD
ncbi:hypothetical protein HMPREF0321_0026 [Dermacoccus sp. Ellin185]|nr:hypothetical protein HMPREF0321_0026 [Dermacoccus sp. Ellin185]